MHHNATNTQGYAEDVPQESSDRWWFAIIHWIVMALVCVILPQALVKAVFIFCR